VLPCHFAGGYYNAAEFFAMKSFLFPEKFLAGNWGAPCLWRLFGRYPWRIVEQDGVSGQKI
jgi:hypothetical protein